jgi:predicted phage baseplate assembly protein
MSLPAPNLDDLRFQSDLVDEARRRIIRYCPEWTEYNLSDPGITLIELFAWMTEMILYRMNQVPQRNYIKFLELIGMQRQPASSARTDLTFWLSVTLPISPENQDPVIIPEGTEVVSRHVGEEEEVVFTTDVRLVVVPPKLDQVRREDEFHKNYLPRLGIETFYAFQQRPQIGDTFYLGFDDGQDISGHILQLAFSCEPTQAVGVRREDPPWVWECSLGNDLWEEVLPSTRPGEKDTTGGLNNPSGRLTLYLPLEMKPDQVHGRTAYWLRCRLEPRRPEQGMYAESPRVRGITAYALGGTVPATQAVVVENEILGRSSGEPGQTFHLEYAPILALQEGEAVEVEEMQHGDLVFVPWHPAENFAHSDRFDRHFVVDTATGEVVFGPAIRQPDGTVRQYGRVLEAGRTIRVRRYRTGGGVKGNVPVGSLTVLTTSLAYVSRVSNLRRASGGQDPETLEEVVMRAQREMKAQLRAVTAEDYELLAKKASRSVARVKCNVPRSSSGRDGGRSSDRAGSHVMPGTVEIIIVPSAADSLRAGDLSGLHVDRALASAVEEYLDQYRLLTTILRIKEPNYVGVKVHAEIVPSEFSSPEIVRARAVEALRVFLSPLLVAEDPSLLDDIMGSEWEGWPFGRDLYAAELFSLLQRVPGVKHVLDVQLSTRAVVPGKELPPEEREEGRPVERLVPVEGKAVRIPANTLVCSLDHEITMMELDEDHE